MAACLGLLFIFATNTNGGQTVNTDGNLDAIERELEAQERYDAAQPEVGMYCPDCDVEFDEPLFSCPNCENELEKL